MKRLLPILAASAMAITTATLLARLANPTICTRDDLAKAAVGSNGPIAKALDAFVYDVRRFPTTTEGLQVLSRAPIPLLSGWSGPYIHDVLVEDPWEEPYQYRYPGIHNRSTYDLWSKGANRVSEPDQPESDDIRNWRHQD